MISHSFGKPQTHSHLHTHTHAKCSCRRCWSEREARCKTRGERAEKEEDAHAANRIVKYTIHCMHFSGAPWLFILGQCAARRSLSNWTHHQLEFLAKQREQLMSHGGKMRVARVEVAISLRSQAANMED